MNRELLNLRKKLEKLQKTNQEFYLKLNDKIYYVKGETLLEAKEITENIKVYEINCYDKELFYFFSIDGEPVYTILD